MKAFRSASPSVTLPVALLLLITLPLVGLILLKWPAAIATLKGTLATGSFHAKPELFPTEGISPWIRPFTRTLSYLYTVRWALFYGILISSTIRVFLSPRLIDRLLGESMARGQLVAGTLGAPLMLCSCCVAPVAVGAFRRTGKLGPALGLLLAAPSLNPAALALTFVLFPMSVGFARLGMALAMVFVGSAVVAALRPGKTANLAHVWEAESAPMNSLGNVLLAFSRAVGKTSLQTLPFVALGVLFSMALTQVAPIEKLATASQPLLAILGIAALAVPLALPTFLELPIGLTLMGAHAPLGAVAALLFVGPAINLPSLLTLSKAAGTRVALLLAGVVFVIAVLGGALI